ncbi:hypothetical protein FB45DRAFT_1002709 [Roridomyces roridus]|uniref:Uncharacterized protein n=1 Tax=Roridomyces roridus TaxID=1738132 RepID=A0AAD7C0H8_9AGAR|nr:hypothetical protein FB45DRAFT_1002709 [Roridomyces roridus]
MCLVGKPYCGSMDSHWVHSTFLPATCVCTSWVSALVLLFPVLSARQLGHSIDAADVSGSFASEANASFTFTGGESSPSLVTVLKTEWVRRVARDRGIKIKDADRSGHILAGVQRLYMTKGSSWSWLTRKPNGHIGRVQQMPATSSKQAAEDGVMGECTTEAIDVTDAWTKSNQDNVPPCRFICSERAAAHARLAAKSFKFYWTSCCLAVEVSRVGATEASKLLEGGVLPRPRRKKSRTTIRNVGGLNPNPRLGLNPREFKQKSPRQAAA